MRISLPCVLALLIVLAASSLRADETRAGSIRFIPPRKVALPDGSNVTVDYGKIAVPENRKEPKSRLIDLAFARVRATTEAKGPPLIYLHGGPGGSATNAASNPQSLAVWRPFLGLGDVVFLDQRGCGHSEPDLTTSAGRAIPADIFESRAAAKNFLNTGARHLAAKLRERGVDQRGYHTEESADDVNTLREALGADRMRILGFSYGTHLGLSILRRHGAHVDRAILVGVEGPDHTFKLPSNYDAHIERVTKLIAADAHLGKEMPDFGQAVRNAIARLKESPLEITARDPVTGNSSPFRVGAWGLAYLLVRDLGDTSDLTVLPRLVDEVARGETRTLTWFAQKRLREFASLNGVFLLVDPASGGSPARMKRIEAEARNAILGNAMNFPFPDASTGLSAPRLGEESRSPLTSDVETLFISGDLDSNTPPAQAEEIRAGFSRGKALLLVNAGHEDWKRLDVIDVIFRFVLDGDPGRARIELPAVRFAPLRGRAPGFDHPALR